MQHITHRTIEANGISLHIAEAGEGPLVVLCHGFPESWYSWRHQLIALAEAGFHAIAPDMRGYGQTSAPDAIGQYTMMHLVGDMVGLVDALGEKTAAIAGHDWGAPVAWSAALLRPDRFRAVIGLSVPFIPRANIRPTSAMPQNDQALFYQLYFQEPGLAEAELEHNVRLTISSLLYSASGDSEIPIEAITMVPRNGGFLTHLHHPEALPNWLSEADINFYASELSSTGFRGGLNWYRNIDRNWELMAPFAGLQIRVPALFVSGENDLVMKIRGMEMLVPNLKVFVPELRGTIILPACGHWTQQERPEEVNAAIIRFLKTL